MSITDELREYVGRYKNSHDAWSGIGGDLDRIADRIDAKHQKAIRELNNLADASVLLPVDADGEIIHVGDMMERGEARGHVIALMLSEYPKKWGGGLHWSIQLEGEQAPTALDLTFHHHHAPTVEDVLREFGRGWHEQMNGPETFDIADYVERYAAKLRLAGDAE